MSSCDSDASSSVVAKRTTLNNKKSTTVINCMMTPSCPAPYSSYAVVSPVLLPYVQAPVQYVNGNKPKSVPAHASSSPTTVRYVPAYTYTPLRPQYLCYNNQCLSQVKIDDSFNLAQRLGIPFAMRINPDARRLNRGYVSALTPPAAYLADANSDVLLRSDLNPLSRPYTPPNRLKQCTCALKNLDSDGENSRQETVTLLTKTYCYDCAAVDECRVGTPISCCSSTSRWSSKNDLYSSLSDTDSGVEGECDDDEFIGDDECYSCKATEKHEPPVSSVERLDSVSNLNLKYSEEVHDSLPFKLKSIVDFLCLHLDSHEWRTVAREMGVNDVLIQSVEYDFYDSFKDQMKLVFTHWANLRKSDDVSGSSEVTSKALKEIGRADLIELLNININD